MDQDDSGVGGGREAARCSREGNGRSIRASTRSRRRSSTDQAQGIVASHTLIPEALYHAFATFGALMSPDLPLERRQHEMIATMVSLTNRCHY